MVTGRAVKCAGQKVTTEVELYILCLSWAVQIAWKMSNAYNLCLLWVLYIECTFFNACNLWLLWVVYIVGTMVNTCFVCSTRQPTNRNTRTTVMAPWTATSISRCVAKSESPAHQHSSSTPTASSWVQSWRRPVLPVIRWTSWWPCLQSWPSQGEHR